MLYVVILFLLDLHVIGCYADDTGDLRDAIRHSRQMRNSIDTDNSIDTALDEVDVDVRKPNFTQTDYNPESSDREVLRTPGAYFIYFKSQTLAPYLREIVLHFHYTRLEFNSVLGFN